MRILTNSILPPNIRFMLAEADEGGGAATAEAPEKMGSAFERMGRQMRDEPEPELTDKKATESSSGNAASADETEAAAAAAKDAAAAEKEKEKAKKRTPKDPLLDMLAPEKKEEKKPDPTEDEAARKKAREDEIAAATKGLSTNAAANFKKVTEARYKAEDEAAALRKQLESLKTAKPELPEDVKAKLAEYETLKKERDELAGTMEKIGAERSPAYQNKFVKGKQKLIEKAQTLVTRYGGDPEKFKAAMQLPAGRERSDAIAEAIADMHQLDTQRVAGVLTEIETLEDESGNFLANARQSLAEEERRAQEQEREQMTHISRAREEAFMVTVNKMLHKLPDDHPLAAESNPLVDKAVETAKKFLFEASDFGQFAEASVAYAMHPILKERLSAAAQKIAELEAQLEELTDADPTLGSGGGEPGKGEEPKTFAERYHGANTAAA